MKTKSRDNPLFAATALTAPLVPSIAAVVSVVLFLLGTPGSQVPMYGAFTALLLWLITALFSRDLVSVDHANPGIYNQLRERAHSLKVLLDQNANPSGNISSRNEVNAHLEFVKKALGEGEGEPKFLGGLQWVTATGYIDLWNRIHRAEEALIEMEPRLAVGRALYDEGRLRGSAIPDRDTLLLRLVKAREAVERSHKMSKAPDRPNSEKITPPAEEKPPGEVTGDSTLSSEQNGMPAPEDALTTLRATSHMINKYRDDRWEGLARARNQLNDTGLFTSIFAFILLSILLVTMNVTATQILAATLYFLIGAIVGLFNRLAAESSSNTAIEDYGLNLARLIQTPLFSGLAAIGGVVLMAMLPISVEGGVQGLSLSAIFDLGQNRFGLVTAAVFGLTPRLLINRLQSQAESYKDDLQKSEAAEKG